MWIVLIFRKKTRNISNEVIYQPKKLKNTSKRANDSKQIS